MVRLGGTYGEGEKADGLTARSRVASCHRVLARAVRVLASCALVASCTTLLCSCRPTDFFTEVIISPFADQVDEDNPQRLIVNDPQAEQETDQLSALDWSDNSSRSTQVQNLVTYSDNPTTNMNAFRSVFDLDPRFMGVQSSEAVQLDFSQPSSVSESDSQTPVESDLSPQERSDLQGEAARSEGVEQVQQASGTGDNPADSGADKGEGGTEGSSGGYNGERKIYDPNNGFAEPPHADKIAACGQAAVMVEALGGGEALAAMDSNTYYGTNTSSVGSFAEVFGDELPSDFAQTALLWSGSGTSPSNLTDAEALASACGEGGVIVYDQGEGDLESRFSTEALEVLDRAGITYIPVDFSTVQGMLDAANVIGEVLSESPYAPLAKSNAEAYWKTVDDLVTQAADSHGGALAARDESTSGTRLLSTYNSCPVSSWRTNHTFSAFGTSYVRGIGYTNGSYALDSESGLLFTGSTASSPLSFWAQAAGVWNRGADVVSSGSPKNDTAMLYGVVTGARFDSSFFSSASGAPELTRCVSSVLLGTEDRIGTTSDSNFGDGLGSAAFPYLIVSASGNSTSDQVKQSVVAQMLSSDPLNPYSILPWNKQSPNNMLSTEFSSISIIGSTTDNAKGSVFHDQGVSASDTVRANPSGLLGSWTAGSMESVLETVWLARIYSAAPANSDYSPICSYSVQQLEDAVMGFYETFYRMEASEAQSAYERVVTDEGL